MTARCHVKKQMTLSELSATINVEDRARASNEPSKQVQAHLVEKGGGGKFQQKKNYSPPQNQNKPKPKKMKEKKDDFVCYVCVSLGIQPGGAMIEREKVLYLSAKKGTWWLTPP